MYSSRNNSGRNRTSRNRKKKSAGKSPASKDSSTDKNKPSVPVMISGFNPNSKIPHLIDFLIRSTNNSIQIYKNLVEDRNLFVETKSIEHASTLSKLNGVLYEGYILTIQMCAFRSDIFKQPRPSTASHTAPPPSKVELLLQLLSERYQANEKSLDLSSLHLDPRVRQLQLHLNGVDDTLRKALGNLVVHERFIVHHLTLDKNHLRNFHNWGSFFKFLTQVESLSLRHNRIRETRGLLSLTEFDGLTSNLNSLDIRENPMCVSPHTREYKEYHSSLVNLFPNLKQLDGITFAPSSATSSSTLFDLNNKIEEMAIRPSLFDSIQTQQITLAFLNAFFYSLDNDRDQLVHVYHPEALFSCVSIAGNGSHHHSSNSSGNHYAPFNRNLKQTQTPDERFQKLFHSPSSIVFALKGFPKTRHILETMVIDSWSMTTFMPNGTPTLHIFVHGEFKEFHIRAPETWKSFDRCLFLLPIPSSSDPSQVNYQIIQDQLTIRPRVINPPWLELKNSPPPSASAPPPVFPVQLTPQNLPPKPPEMSDHDYNLVLLAMQQHGLTWDGAIICLSQTNGDLQKIANFKILRQIPNDFFQRSSSTL
ncbi:nuclear mRNA export, poly(A)+RNA binding protein [Coelomomyces lativittatus]|nr:nuclear mRNA export, poly(A)+RNA binding protein [Coelomomyces lativittatus]